MNNARLLALAPLLATVAASGTGCKEYYTLDEACTKNPPSGKGLTPVEIDGFYRLNCHRRLAGVVKGAPNELIVEAARNELQYVLQNPNIDALGGEEREHFWLTQALGKDGFTGVGLFERLTDPSTGTGYQFYDVLGSAWWEYLDIVVADSADELPSGADAIDYMMRTPEFRQAALQPSMLDGGYAELDLPATWFEGWSNAYPESAAPQAARAYYYAAVFTAPHIEHANTPVLYPKEDQKDVPIWAPSAGLVGASGRPALTGYPVTFQVGTVDTSYFLPIDQNQYQAEILGATIQSADGTVIETRNIVPGTDASGTLSDGLWLRNTLSVVPIQPLEAGTTYSVFAQVQTPESTFDIDYQFTTAADDPGYDATRQAVGTTPVTTTTATYGGTP